MATPCVTRLWDATSALRDGGLAGGELGNRAKWRPSEDKTLNWSFRVPSTAYQETPQGRRGVVWRALRDCTAPATLNELEVVVSAHTAGSSDTWSKADIVRALEGLKAGGWAIGHGARTWAVAGQTDAEERQDGPKGRRGTLWRVLSASADPMTFRQIHEALATPASCDQQQWSQRDVDRALEGLKASGWVVPGGATSWMAAPDRVHLGRLIDRLKN
jgi:hypothetical protein